jgi:hypothetical protein
MGQVRGRSVRRGGGGATSGELGRLSVRVHRTEQVVRGETGTVTVRFVPKPLFFERPEDERAEIVRELGQIRASDLHLRHDGGEVSLFRDYVNQFVLVEAEDVGDWEYDGGEVSTLKVRYDHIESVRPVGSLAEVRSTAGSAATASPRRRRRA